MTRAKLQAVHPILPFRYVRASVDFYVTRLGSAFFAPDLNGLTFHCDL